MTKSTAHTTWSTVDEVALIFPLGFSGLHLRYILALHMGFRRSPPPFLAVANKTGNQLFRGLQGANFASAGSGILDTTGSSIIPMGMQVEQFATVQRNISAHISKEAADSVLSRSLFLISTGGNDIFAFFSRKQHTDGSGEAAVQTAGIDNPAKARPPNVQALYDLGARKFAVIDVPPIGCCPYPRSLHPLGACIDVLNELARELNKGVKDAMHGHVQRELHRLQALDRELPRRRAEHHEASPATRYLNIRFKEVTTACCGSGRFNGGSGCTPNATMCDKRHEYLFWDLLHPTHATSKLAAVAIYNGSLRFAAPINFRQLVEDQH
ncbi:hypothetical protein GUJ93_ZPchr0006g41973 [Zizania palustris]|uniref:GDSL esterase/lipase n=1 Tax=Zizania palustris TaxID=103762 RepID=A0A8J5SRP8_ZIZPA|nr:hypothetical protein GUJ93_ZPchr0006g41973 [Zizania palustris]